ncbi:MAG TPA: FlgD immunoglobulin-like domain containing protein [Frankiaceae bacterium]|nr:FlgD immunoglobulin-like domain containing protein [Frankiaceae bacterium]
MLAGRALCTAANDQTNPILVADGAGGAFVAWKDPRPGTSPPDIYLQRVAGSGALAAGWPSAATALGACTAAGTQQSPAMIRDGGAPGEAGSGVILAWQDLRGGTADIYAVRIGGDGSVAPGWTADGTPVCSASGTQGAPAMVDDAAGGAIVVWSDGRATPSAIYAQRIGPDGAVAPTTGVAGRPAPGTLGVALRPNPTRGGALARLALPAPARVTAEVLDPAGRRVRLLCAGRELPAGETTLAWDGCDMTGARAAAGLYFVRVMAGGTTVTRRLAVTP